MEENKKRGRPRQYKRGYPGTERGAPMFRTRLDPDCYDWITSQVDTRGVLQDLIREAMGPSKLVPGPKISENEEKPRE